MDRGVAKLLEYIAADGMAQEFVELAYESYFADFSEITTFDELEDIRTLIGTAAFDQIIPCALEFFFSNDYRVGRRGPQTNWNVIDAFLAAGGSTLEPHQEEYLRTLRLSHMSVYEVVAVEPGRALTVRELVDGAGEETVPEKAMTRSVKPGDILGLRICREKGRPVFSGGCVPLPPAARDELVRELRDLTKLTLAAIKLEEAAAKDRGKRPRKGSRAAADAALYAQSDRLTRVMWAPVIGLVFMLNAFAAKIRESGPLPAAPARRRA